MSHTKPTHLKPHRKRSGFTQQELAFLIGGRKHSAISRYEAGQRSPDLETAFAYQVLFDGELLRKLFPGLYDKVRARVLERVKALAERLQKEGIGDRKRAYKIARLRRLADEESNAVSVV